MAELSLVIASCASYVDYLFHKIKYYSTYDVYEDCIYHGKTLTGVATFYFPPSYRAKYLGSTLVVHCYQQAACCVH